MLKALTIIAGAGLGAAVVYHLKMRKAFRLTVSCVGCMALLGARLNHLRFLSSQGEPDTLKESKKRLAASRDACSV